MVVVLGVNFDFAHTLFLGVKAGVRSQGGIVKYEGIKKGTIYFFFALISGCLVLIIQDLTLISKAAILFIFGSIGLILYLNFYRLTLPAVKKNKFLKKIISAQKNTSGKKRP